MPTSMSRSAGRPLRTTPFGTRTHFKRPHQRRLTKVGLTILRILKPEAQARALESIHFAYWTMIPRKRMAQLLQACRPDRKRPHKQQPVRDEMLFLSEFSGGWEDYLVSFNQVLISALDLAWGTATTWKRRMEVHDYLDFVRRFQLVAPHHMQAYGADASVQDVRDALQLSEELEQFVWEVQQLDAEQFAAALKRLRIAVGSRLVS